jgi:hypothetical protein
MFKALRASGGICSFRLRYAYVSLMIDIVANIVANIVVANVQYA